MEGSDTYDEKTFGLSFSDGVKETYFGITALDTGKEQSFSMSLSFDENAIAFGLRRYDGNGRGRRIGDLGVLYAYYSDATGNDILATLNVDSVLNADGGIMPDFSGKEMIALEDLMQALEEDEELMSEFEAAYFNALTALLEIPAVSEMMIGENVEQRGINEKSVRGLCPCRSYCGAGFFVVLIGNKGNCDAIFARSFVQVAGKDPIVHAGIE